LNTILPETKKKGCEEWPSYLRRSGKNRVNKGKVYCSSFSSWGRKGDTFTNGDFSLKM
jgi:hypothetical protein